HPRRDRDGRGVLASLPVSLAGRRESGRAGAAGRRDGHLHGQLRPRGARWIAAGGRRCGGPRLFGGVLRGCAVRGGARRALIFDVSSVGARTAPRYAAGLMAQRATQAETAIDRKVINRLTEEQMARFREHTPTSAEYFDRARKVMPGGVPSSFQLNDPW